MILFAQEKFEIQHNGLRYLRPVAPRMTIVFFPESSRSSYFSACILVDHMIHDRSPMIGYGDITA